MKLLQVIRSLDPKLGGTVEAVRQLTGQLIRLGHEVDVLTLDEPAAPYLGTCGSRVHAVGPSLGWYGLNSRMGTWFASHAGRYDAVIINGLWQYHSLGTWRALRGLGVPYFVFPHGMLDPWFRRQYPLKHAKKWLYWPWADYRVLRDAKAVLFTCEEECRRAPESFWLYRATPAVVGFGTEPPPADGDRLRRVFLRRYPHLDGKRVLLFLGRIHEKKGCDLAVEAFARVADRDPTLRLVIAGPDSGGLQAKLQRRAAELGIAAGITWTGMLAGELKWAALYASDALLLPSHQENFGIVVAEALGCGVPVLISDKVNIWREIESGGAGLVAPDTPGGTERNLSEWLAFADERRAVMRDQARTTYRRYFTIDSVALRVIEATMLSAPAPETAGTAPAARPGIWPASPPAPMAD